MVDELGQEDKSESTQTKKVKVKFGGSDRRHKPIKMIRSQSAMPMNYTPPLLI